MSSTQLNLSAIIGVVMNTALSKPSGPVEGELYVGPIPEQIITGLRTMVAAHIAESSRPEPAPILIVGLRPRATPYPSMTDGIDPDRHLRPISPLTEF